LRAAGRGKGAALALESLEAIQGAVEAAADRVLVAEEAAEGVGAADVAQVGQAEQPGGLVVLLLGGPLLFVAGFALAGVVEAVPIEAGLDAGEAAEAPVGGADLMDKHLLEGTVGLKSGVEGFEEFEEGLCVLVGEDQVLGEEAVLEGIEA